MTNEHTDRTAYEKQDKLDLILLGMGVSFFCGAWHGCLWLVLKPTVPNFLVRQIFGQEFGCPCFGQH